MKEIKYPNKYFLKKNLKVGDLVYLLPAYKKGDLTNFYVGFAIVTEIFKDPRFDEPKFKTNPDYSKSNSYFLISSLADRCIYFPRQGKTEDE